MFADETDILNALRQGGLSCAEIGNRAKMSRMTVYKIVKQLERRGLIRKEKGGIRQLTYEGWNLIGPRSAFPESAEYGLHQAIVFWITLAVVAGYISLKLQGLI